MYMSNIHAGSWIEIFRWVLTSLLPSNDKGSSHITILCWSGVTSKQNHQLWPFYWLNLAVSCLSFLQSACKDKLSSSCFNCRNVKLITRYHDQTVQEDVFRTALVWIHADLSRWEYDRTSLVVYTFFFKCLSFFFSNLSRCLFSLKGTKYIHQLVVSLPNVNRRFNKSSTDSVWGIIKE